MFVLGNFIQALAMVIHTVFQIYWWILIARIILSWVNPNPMNDIIRQIIYFVYRATDPVLYKIRQVFPFLVVGGLDLSPIALFLVLGFVDQFVYYTLLDLARTMR